MMQILPKSSKFCDASCRLVRKSPNVPNFTIISQELPLGGEKPQNRHLIKFSTGSAAGNNQQLNICSIFHTGHEHMPMQTKRTVSRYIYKPNW